MPPERKKVAKYHQSWLVDEQAVVVELVLLERFDECCALPLEIEL